MVCGQSGVGKSASAAALALRGDAVLADKVVVIADPPGLSVSGSPTEVALWPPTARALGLDPMGATQVRPALDKRKFRLGRAPSAAPIPVSLIVMLEIDNRLAEPQLEELTDGRQKLGVLVAALWHRRLLAPLGLGMAHLEWSASVAGAVRVVRLRRPRHPWTIDGVADLIATALEDR